MSWNTQGAGAVLTLQSHCHPLGTPSPTHARFHASITTEEMNELSGWAKGKRSIFYPSLVSIGRHRKTEAADWNGFGALHSFFLLCPGMLYDQHDSFWKDLWAFLGGGEGGGKSLKQLLSKRTKKKRKKTSPALFRYFCKWKYKNECFFQGSSARTTLSLICQCIHTHV